MMNVNFSPSLILACLMSVSAYAQKGSVSKADYYLTKKDYAKAKAEIDVAITIEKNAKKSRTWFTRGRIYDDIASSKDPAIIALDPEALAKAVEAYNKVIEMDKETSPNRVLANTSLDRLWGAFLNSGAANHQKADYDSALMQFEQALTVRPTDSVTLFYAALTSQQANKIDKALKYFYQMTDMGIANTDVYATLISLESNKNKNHQKALELVREAKEKFPNEPRYGKEEITLLIMTKQLDDARNKLEKAVAEDPTNVSYQTYLGQLYDNLGRAKMSEGKTEEGRKALNQAKECYMKIVELEPDSYIGNYNAGAIYITLAKEYYDRLNDMDMDEYQKHGKALSEKANNILKESLPYMEQAVRLKPDDVDGLQSLYQIYRTLKMFDKAEALQKKIDALEGK